VPSPNIAACLPNAGGRVTITPGKLNDIMKVSVHGMPARAGFDLFVIQQPPAPFGVSWYQTDVDANQYGSGSAIVRGVFDAPASPQDRGANARPSPPPATTKRSPQRSITTEDG
jgi:hypothetical protein